MTVLGLQRLYDRILPAEDQSRVLRQLGSDVPFFAHGGRAIGTGRGDEIQLLGDGKEASEIKTDYWLALVNPRFAISTAEAYSWLTVFDKSNSIGGFCAQFVPGSGYAEQINDFEAPVFVRHPQLMEIRDELLRIGAFRAALSGSGSVVFGQFRTELEARRAEAALNWRYFVKVARPLSRAEYFSRMVD